MTKRYLLAFTVTMFSCISPSEGSFFDSKVEKQSATAHPGSPADQGISSSELSQKQQTQTPASNSLSDQQDQQSTDPGQTQTDEDTNGSPQNNPSP